MARSTQECAAIIAACRRVSVKLGLAYYRRFYPLLERMRQLIGEGQIGDVLSVSATAATPLEILPGQEGYWRVDPELAGGGALMDIGSHRIEIFLDFFGDVNRVKAICPPPTLAGQTETTAALLLEFERGVVGTLKCHFGTTAMLDAFAIVGTKGQLMTDCLNGPELILETGGRRVLETHPPAENLSSPLVADFVTAILEDREPMITGEMGLAVNEVMQRAYADAGAEI